MQSLEEIESLAGQMRNAKTALAKIAVLDQDPWVEPFLKTTHPLYSQIRELPLDKQAAIKQFIAIRQAPSGENPTDHQWEDFLNRLLEVDRFYREIGGIIGYQHQVLRLLAAKESKLSDARYHSPSFIDISHETKEVSAAIEAGIQAMPFLCEMYPVGGAADRLHLVDESTGHELPAAKLEFARTTLLERLLRDLEAREYLYFKRTGKILTVPVALMTSHEKDNWIHVQDILEKNGWFGRPKDRFRLFVQPLVPAVNQHGNWIWSAPWKMLMKPGGHGAIWKLALDHGIFDYFRQLGTRFALVRQINNPLAGLDYGLLAFTGIGFTQKKSFGFASCPRLCLSAEGMNVLVERKIPHGFSYVVSNIEYTDFEKHSIPDRPLVPNEPYSRFTSNTNILFADLSAIEAAVEKTPFPGLIINLKKKSDGVQIGRLESAMQNIADVFVERKRKPLTKESHDLKKTFITYNRRHKTISTTKKAMADGGSFSETPENCFYDLLRAHRELLQDVCRFSLPPDRTLEEVLASHPPFVFLFHPALGPLFQTIGQKVRQGRLGDGSELILEIAEADIENLSVDGSLQIIAKNPTGSPRFSAPKPRCVLKNVQVVNAGIDWEQSRPFWKARYHRKESIVIILHGRSEFVAENVRFEKGHCFEVQDGERLVVLQDGKCLKMKKEAAAL
ncbi:MAG: Uncharacterized protein HW387_1120 [Parachlamydiales bacterium]|nr:Uncharacterized protein [Parachlamydiales bacterium]